MLINMIFKKDKDLKLKIAYIISRLGEPFLWLSIFGVIILFSEYLDGYNYWLWGIGLVLFLGFMPLVTLWLGIKKIKGLDIDLTKRESRTPFILIILFYWLLGLILAWSLAGPKLILVLLLIGIILNILILIINFYWKISNHSLVLTTVILFSSQLLDKNYLWLLLILPLVAWSRWIQRKHTWWQLIGGIGLAILAWLILMAFGY